MIDEFPAFTIAACFANGTTRVSDAYELRHKETDRITSLCIELTKIGASIEEFRDGFIVYGGNRFKGGTVSPHGDHRLAMALAIAGLHADRPVIISDANIISESFPSFESILLMLGADVHQKSQ
jgi:3-phosphoshikimate 1-carboxyvinyltransferase